MAPPQDKRSLQYIARTREWYEGLGFGEPYRWAQFDEVPFFLPAKPLSESVIAIITTAALYYPDNGDQGPGASYNSKAKFYTVYSSAILPQPDVRISHIAYDRTHTTAEDMNTWFPLQALKRLESAGIVGKVADRFFGLPTNRSQRQTMQTDCPQLLKQMNGIDMAILVANCPVCHQSVSLAARHLESAGIPTVIMGCAKDIVEGVGVPRFLFSDNPLGNAAGKPFDVESQSQTIIMATDLFIQARAPRTTRQSEIEWSASHNWKQDYNNIAKLSPQEKQARREEFNRQKVIAKQQK